MELQDNYTRLYRWIKQRHHLVKNKLPPTIGVLDPDGYDDPIRFLDLSPLEQTVLVAWVLNTLAPSKGTNYTETSYSLKHYFNDSSCGFYVLNGCMKGAMLVAGFTTDNIKQRNWSFNVAEASYKNVHKTNAHTRYINLFKNRLPNKGKVSLS